MERWRVSAGCDGAELKQPPLPSSSQSHTIPDSTDSQKVRRSHADMEALERVTSDCLMDCSQWASHPVESLSSQCHIALVLHRKVVPLLSSLSRCSLPSSSLTSLSASTVVQSS